MGTAATPHAAIAIPVGDDNERQRVRSALENLVQKHETSLLWVGPCVGSRALHRSYQSARALAPHVHRLATRPALVDFAEFREAALLATVPEEMREAYVADVLGGIEGEPRHRARRLLRTVEVLVHCDSLKAAANALGVNVKTVRRRIEQAEQLSGLRLDRPDDLHRARTALTLRTMSLGRTATG
jgi:PucR family transcriptional regulator, purine catabolism regulatory protein